MNGSKALSLCWYVQMDVLRKWYFFFVGMGVVGARAYCFMPNWCLLFVDGKHPACDQSYFGRREFSFTLENDIYLRYQSFNNVVQLENSIKEKCPFKIDIGPVYSVDVSGVFVLFFIYFRLWLLGSCVSWA